MPPLEMKTVDLEILIILLLTERWSEGRLINNILLLYNVNIIM